MTTPTSVGAVDMRWQRRIEELERNLADFTKRYHQYHMHHDPQQDGWRSKVEHTLTSNTTTLQQLDVVVRQMLTDMTILKSGVEALDSAVKALERKEVSDVQGLASRDEMVYKNLEARAEQTFAAMLGQQQQLIRAAGTAAHDLEIKVQ